MPDGKSTAGYDNGLTRFKIVRDDMHLFRAYNPAQILDDLSRDHRPMVAETNDFAHTLGIRDLAGAGDWFESREEITRKQCLGERNWTFARNTLELDTGQIDFDFEFLFQMRRGDMLVLRLRAKAKPVRVVR